VQHQQKQKGRQIKNERLWGTGNVGEKGLAQKNVKLGRRELAQADTRENE
jgi:hypothetical protein